jgi:hypothetical protein
MFSEEKSRGFHLNSCHLSAPTRLCRLLITAWASWLTIIELAAIEEKLLNNTLGGAIQCDSFH